MTFIPIDGKKIAEQIIADLKQLPNPGKMLAAVLVGDNAQSKSFLRQKERIAQALDIPFHLYQFNEAITEEDLITEIKRLGSDAEIGGIIVQLPLPAHYDRNKILAAVNPRKDVDALSLESKKFVDPLPVAVVKDIICDTNIRMHANDTNNTNKFLRDKVVAVIGRGFLVGKPIAEWLNGKCGKLILLNSKSNLNDLSEADLVITGVGKGGLLQPKMLKPGALVIDFGYDLKDRKIKGDFDSDILNPNPYTLKPIWYTPTPGGTGPILVAEIFRNFYKLNNS